MTALAVFGIWLLAGLAVGLVIGGIAHKDPPDLGADALRADLEAAVDEALAQVYGQPGSRAGPPGDRGPEAILSGRRPGMLGRRR